MKVTKQPEKPVIYPCPFCFGELMGHAYILSKSGPDKVCISCTTCGAGGPVGESGGSLEEIRKADNEAIRLWNNVGNFKATEQVPL